MKETLLYLKRCHPTSQYQAVEALNELWEAKAPYERKKLLRTPDEGSQPQQQQWRRQDVERPEQLQLIHPPRREGEPPVNRSGGKPFRGWMGMDVVGPIPYTIHTVEKSLRTLAGTTSFVLIVRNLDT